MKKSSQKKSRRRIIWGIIIAILAFLTIPDPIQMPVENATQGSFNHNTFWHPWGDHYHRGVDIFAKRNTNVHPASPGIVLAAGALNKMGGNCVFVLSRGLRLHYYAHLENVSVRMGQPVSRNTVIGSVGNSGNAKSTPCHLHYSISSIIPSRHCKFGGGNGYPVFFIDPVYELEKLK